MSAVSDARPESPIPRVHLAGWVGVLLGSAISLISMTTMSWYTVAGTGVVNDLQDLEPNGGPVFLVPKDIGRHHSISWILLIACIVSALVALARPKYRVPARVVTGVLAAALIAVAVAKVSVNSIVAEGVSLDTGAHMHAVLRIGFWTALAGYALLGLAMIAIRGRQPNESS